LDERRHARLPTASLPLRDRDPPVSARQCDYARRLFFAIIPEVTETKIVIGALKGHDRALEMYLRDESSTAVLGRLGEVDVPWKRSLVYDSVGLECHSAAPQERYL
jgi:hypothetical protein